MNVLVTAGPTREFLDPVRFLSNRSSGKMGYALAMAAAEREHKVILVSGPVTIPPPDGVTVVPVVSALDMLAAVEKHIEWCNAFVMCAAVADWRPESRFPEKLKKTEMSPTLKLVRNPDILETVKERKGNRMFVGFAAETGSIMEEAERKMREKRLDMIVANDVSKPDSGFAVDNNRVTILAPGADPEYLPLMNKSSVAVRIIERIENRR